MKPSLTGSEAPPMDTLSTSRIITGAAAREVVARSLAQSARAIGASLGPLGRGLMYDGGSGGPRHANGGLAIARQVTQESGAWSVAPRLLRDALWDVQRDLGDGTARTACIAVAAHAVAAARVAQGVPPVLLGDAIRRIAGTLPAMLDAQRCPAPDALAIARAACGDEEVARAVAHISASLSEAGAVDVSEGWRPGVRFEQFDGYCLDVKPDAIGAGSAEQGMRLEMDTVHVLVVNEVLSDFGPLVRVLEQFVSRSKSLVVVARGIEGAARATLVANRAGLRMHVLGLVPADAGLHAMSVLEDLCAVTGATLVSEETGVSIAGVRPAMLGRVARLVVDGARALFIDPAGTEQDITARRALILAEADAQRHVSLDRERLLRRAARLALGWGELRVGGHTAWETGQRMDGARAALAAVRAARQQGVVAGGGQALNALADALPHALRDEFPDMALPVRRAALDAVTSGCRVVAAQIARNAGVEVASLSIPDDVVDPLSTTLAIVRRAFSVAATLLTIEVLIC
jgi:chaperonin GroEL